jgi:ParB family chromosome partitioning protein
MAGPSVQEVAVSLIDPNPLQPRSQFDEADLQGLAQSIREYGVLQPLVVELDGDRYRLVAGERRLRASQLAGATRVPVVVRPAGPDRARLEMALVENLHREDLNPIEEATAYQQLIDEFSYTHDQVSSRVGKSRTAVTNMLRLLQLPAGVQRALADGELTAGHARALLGTPDRSLQEELARRIVVENLTVRAVEEEVRRRTRPPAMDGVGEDAGTASIDSGTAAHVDQPSRQGPESAARGPSAAVDDRRRLPAPGVLELEELLSGHLNTRVKVEMGGKRGKVIVEFATLEDLERIYKLMVGA